MRAMVLERQREPLRLRDLRRPEPGPGEVRLVVSACGVCRTDLHIVDGELPDPRLPLVPGHMIVGRVDAIGPEVTRPAIGDRVGVPWLAHVDGTCEQCRAGRENLCVRGRFTGYDVDGGYAEAAVARADVCLAIPESYADLEAAPLLCAGLIGYRAYRFTGDAPRLGLYGFGDAAHLLTQIAVHQGREVYAFTRPGDAAAQRFALDVGATWAGGSLDTPPVALDAAIIFAPVGDLVPAALRAVGPAGVVVCGGIHMSDIPSFPYRILWQERVVRSVANLTRGDGAEYMRVVEGTRVRTRVEVHPLDEADRALDRLRRGEVQGAAVIAMR